MLFVPPHLIRYLGDPLALQIPRKSQKIPQGSGIVGGGADLVRISLGFFGFATPLGGLGSG